MSNERVHKSAEPCHYDKEAVYYDAFNEKHSEVINQTVETMLREAGAKYSIRSYLWYWSPSILVAGAWF